MVIGTSHFVSVRAAERYYSHYGLDSRDVFDKIRFYEIHIGKPNLQPGQRLVIIDREPGRSSVTGRYAIVEA
jgi:hypothetical protein